MRKHLKKLARPFVDNYHHRYHLPWKHHAPTMLVIDLTLASMAAMVLVGGIFAFYFLPAATPWVGFNMDLTGPSKVTVGAPERIIVAWANDTGKTVECGTLRIVLPPDVKVAGEPETSPSMDSGKISASCLPSNLEALRDSVTVPLGSLASSSRGTVSLPVRFYTDAPTVSVSSDFLYWESGRTDMTRAATKRTWTVDSSVLSLKATWPTKTVLGRETSLTIDYENIGVEALRDVRLKIDVPKNFAATGATPARDADGSFRLRELAPGEKGQAVLYGRFSRLPDVAPSFAVVANFAQGTTVLPLALLRTSADARAADLQLAAEVVSPASTTGLEPGSEVKYVIRYANTGDQPIQHVSFWLDTASLKGIVSGLDSVSMTWDEKSHPELMAVAPGTSGQIDGSIRLMEDALAKTDELTLSVSGRYVLADDVVRPVLVTASPLEFTLTAATRLTARAAYYAPSGDQLGMGPLPPRVGETTQYWIFLKAEAIGKAAKDTTVTTRLPSGVNWTGRVSATAGLAPKYDSATRRVSWNVGLLDPDMQAIAGFEVSLMPGESSIGKIMPLATDIRLTARDAVTEIGLGKVADILTTELLGDMRAIGLGQVSPERKPAKAPKASN